ncbi:MAG TPA: MBL fold metallo-hydrolase [Bacillota bacterium]|nr:MBL fold metallo-hydrolase [Bacillota bacterium]
MNHLEIKYIGHSGFLCDTGERFLLFDLFRDEHNILDRGLPHDGYGMVLISHAHSDHFNPRAFELGVPGRTVYVMDSGIVAPESACEVKSVSPGDVLDIGRISVKVFDSTDEGSSFLVESDGWSVFHSGDLNDWYWEEESTPDELKRDEDLYLQELGRIPGGMDVAFVPVDLRLGRHAARGAQHFARMLRPGYIIPMHMNGRPDPDLFEKALNPTSSGTHPLMMAEGDKADLIKP